MPSLIDMRRRIRSVRSTQQLTKALKMVSAAKLRRAQDRVVAARPYAGILRELIAEVAAAAGGRESLAAHALLARRPEERIQLVLLTADLGKAGAFNTNVIRASQQFLEQRPGARVELELVGRKGRDFYRKRSASITGEHLGLYKQARYEDAAAVARKIVPRYRDREIDAVYILYNEFRSMVSQKVNLRRLLPMELPEGVPPADYIYEQPPGELLESLLPRFVEISVHHAILESAAAEHAARMTAMDAATSNAAEMIDQLTLRMNRVRQASITKEIIEVVSGAAALE